MRVINKWKIPSKTSLGFLYGMVNYINCFIRFWEDDSYFVSFRNTKKKHRWMLLFYVWRFSVNKPPVLLGELKTLVKIKTSWYNSDGLAAASLIKIPGGF